MNQGPGDSQTFGGVWCSQDPRFDDYHDDDEEYYNDNYGDKDTDRHMDEMEDQGYKWGERG